MKRLMYLFSIVGFSLLTTLTMEAQSQSDSRSLTPEQQSIVAISALTATGDMANLKTQLNNGLDAGLTINEIKELLTQLYAYCGFPRSLNALEAFQVVLNDRKSKGINDAQGKAIILTNSKLDRYEQGRKVLEELTRTKQSKPAPGFGEFTPRIDAFLKEHLFADIFKSDVLSYQQRELVTISALSAMKGVEGQLRSHVSIGFNTGLTKDQLGEVATLVEKNIGKTEANQLRIIIEEPLIPIIESGMMVRISEIEIIPQDLEEYNAILKEEAAISVDVEPGVIAIFAMSQKESPTQIRIVEIYASRAAYEAHLQTSHFQRYKTETLRMVKSLRLIDMDALDKESMQEIFKKVR